MDYPKFEQEKQQKNYVKPEIKLELDLEIRAGSLNPDGVDPLDLLGTDF